MVRRIGEALASFCRRWVPDPFILAIFLTAISFLLALVAGKPGFSLFHAIGAWGGRLVDGEVTPDEKGIWRFLTFSMQMCLILVTGHALASTKPVSRLIRRLASLPRTTSSAAAMTAGVAIVAAFINWGLGLIVGALLAREIGKAAKRESKRFHYPLIVAAGYVGLMVWHGGLSGTAPFKMTQMKDVTEVLGERANEIGTVPLDQTVLSPLNLTMSALLLLAVPLFFALLAPKEGDEVIEAPPLETKEEEAEAIETPSDRMNHSWLLSAFVVAAGFCYLFLLVPKVGFLAIDINVIILFFLLLGMLLHGSPMRYAQAINEAACGCGGIILQFPLYAGIQAVLSASGLIASTSQWIAEHSSQQTLPVFTFLSAAIVNLFVPSGGGQWAVQGPIVVDSATQLGSPLGANIMALAYGDEWTNMLQPFWALPLLALTGLKARDIIGYTATVMFLSMPIYIIPLLLFR